MTERPRIPLFDPSDACSEQSRRVDPEQAPAGRPASRWVDWPLALAALVLGLLVYWPALRGELAYDDILVYANNQMISDPANLELLLSPDYFKAAGENTYRPLLTLTYFADYALWGRAAFGPRLTNLLLHVLAALLVAQALGRVGRLSPNAARLGALLFLLHPVAAESVASVGNRDEVLITCIYLLAVLTFVSEPRSKAGQAAKHLGVVLLFITGLFVMELIVTLPAALVLIRVLQAERREQSGDVWGRAFLETLAPWIVVLIYMLVLHSFVTQEQDQRATLAYHGGYLGLLATMPGVLLSYLRMLVWPSGLAADYERSILPLLDWRALAPLLAWLLAAVVVLRWIVRRDRRALAPALFAVTIAPVSQIVPIWFLMADRYLYLPMIPLIGLLVWLGQRLLASRRRAAAALAACVLVIFGGLTWQRAGMWGDSLKLWSDTAAKQPASSVARFNYAFALRSAGRREQALEEYLLALGLLGPTDDELSNAASTLFELERPDEAERLLRDGLARHPQSVVLRTNLALRLLNTGRVAEARPLLAPDAACAGDSVELLEALLLQAMLTHDAPALERCGRRLYALDAGNSMFYQVVGHLEQRLGHTAIAAHNYYLAWRHARSPEVGSQACRRLMALHYGAAADHACRF